MLGIAGGRGLRFTSSVSFPVELRECASRQVMASSSEESRFVDDLKRRRVNISLIDTQISGMIQRVTQRRSVLLEDVYEVKSGRKFPGVKIIFGHEILKVEFPNPANPEKLAPEESHTHSFRKKTPDDVLEDGVHSVLIDELQEKFGPAVMHIQEQKVIGISAEVFGPTAQERLCWLQVATKKVVYLFDILLLGGQAFKNGLSMILENRHILKVVHDCRCITRCLREEFRVHLTNVFDTQVADLMLFYNETGGFLPDRVSSLQEVLRLHLKLPPADLSPLCSKELQRKECPELWYIRPSPPALMSVMSASVRHLLPLRLVLLDALMSDYTILVDAYMSSYHNQSVHIEQSEWTLPAEAQELLSVRQERMDWATGRYDLTEDGLLKRSSFNTQTHSTSDSR
ncbi:piRNA biogenesis protein EXD1 [Carassius gibelio]|nr:piRNA biogenesis protein EXD1 [Carassius gibelio]